MHTIPPAPPAAGEPETAERREYRRRQEDIAAWSELRSFWRNRVTRRVTMIVLPLMFSGLTYAWTTWKHIPTQGWQDNVTVEQQRARDQFNAIQLRIALLDQKVDIAATTSEGQRQEIKSEIAALRTDLQRWFREAAK